MVAATVQQRVKIRGAGWTLSKTLRGYQGEKRVFEFMLDGPRGTSKTVSVGFLLWALAYTHPGIRMLFVRKTRKSITESFCPDWESIVCGGDDECLKGAKADHRSSYEWRNGSRITLMGMDDPHKSYSTSYDVIVAEEAFQFTEDEFEQFRAMLRNWLPSLRFQALIALTNPRHPRHWLLGRVKRGIMTRLKSKHVDNPKWYDAARKCWTPEGIAYMQSLSSMTGVRRRRLYLGEWCSAEGAVWESWDEARHVVDATPARADVRWYCASMDWGYTDACVLLIAAVGQTPDRKRKTITIVRELYMSKQSIEWWSNEVLKAYTDFGIAACVVDPSRPEIVDYFNSRLIEQHPHLREYPVARSADNVRHASSAKGDLAGIDLVRQYIEEDRIKYVRGARSHADDVILREKNRACGLLDEIPEYVYREEDENTQTDATDKDCDDHGCDALRYMTTFAHAHDFHSVAQRRLDPELPPYEAADLAMLGR